MELESILVTLFALDTGDGVYSESLGNSLWASWASPRAKPGPELPIAVEFATSEATGAPLR